MANEKSKPLPTTPEPAQIKTAESVSTEGRDSVECAPSPSAETVRQGSPPLRPSPYERVRVGTGHFLAGRYDEAVKEFKAALKTLRTHDNDDERNIVDVAHVLGNLGAVYLKQNRLFLASEALEEALKLMRTVDESSVDESVIGKIHNNLGNVCFLRDSYNAALDHYNSALEMYQAGKADPIDTAHILFNVGRIYVRHKQWQNAILVLEACHEIEKEACDPSDPALASTIELIGFAQFSTKAYESALCSFSDALLLHRRNGGPTNEGVARNLYNIGMVRESRGQSEEALDCYGKSERIMRHLGVEPNNKQLACAKRSTANLLRRIYSQEELAEL